MHKDHQLTESSTEAFWVRRLIHLYFYVFICAHLFVLVHPISWLYGECIVRSITSAVFFFFPASQFVLSLLNNLSVDTGLYLSSAWSQVCTQAWNHIKTCTRWHRCMETRMWSCIIQTHQVNGTKIFFNRRTTKKKQITNNTRVYLQTNCWTVKRFRRTEVWWMRLRSVCTIKHSEALKKILQLCLSKHAQNRAALSQSNYSHFTIQYISKTPYSALIRIIHFAKQNVSEPLLVSCAALFLPAFSIL